MTKDFFLKTGMITGWATVAFLVTGIGQEGGVSQTVAQNSVAHFEEINVERVNIVEPDGKYRLVLANAERFPGLYMEGIEYEHHSRTGGGMLFYNDEGDEVGGLSYGSAKSPEGYRANGGIMFDQYKQDQTVGLRYSDRNGNRSAGLQVWDRPEYSIKPLMEYSDKAAKANTQEEKDQIRKEMIDFAMANGGVGATRLFAGKEKETALVQLADKDGKARLIMKVDGDGIASIQFLDPEGNVTKTISGDG